MTVAGIGARNVAESVDRCRRILFPRSVAVVGASPRENTLHGRVVRNLLNWDFPGSIYPVNPRYESVAGLPCYESVSAIGEAPDLALVLIGAHRVAGALDDCIAAGSTGAVIFSSGFAEAGVDGALLQDEIVERTAKLALAGPNCNAILSQPSRAALGFGPTLEFPIVDAPRALIAQSGAVATSIVTRAFSKGLGFRYVVSTGNEVDLGVEDYLFFLSEEEQPVRSCLLFLETIRDVPRFAEAAQRCGERGIRLIALKVGRSERGREVSATHTAAMAGPFATYQALFDKLAIWSVETIEQLYLCAQFDWWDDSSRGGLAMLSFSGGQASLAADQAESAGLSLPPLDAKTETALREITGSPVITNPFDCSGQVVNDPERWTRALAAMGDQEDVYALVTFLSVIAGGADETLTSGIIAQARNGRNIALVWPSGNGPASSLPQVTANEIPVFERIEDATACLRIREDGLARGAFSTAELDAYVESLRVDARSSVTENLVATLEAAGLQTPRERSCATVADAVEAFAELGSPLVLKSTTLLHKSELGGVALGLRSGDAVAEAAERLGALHGFPLLAQQQVEGVREVLIGFTRSDLGVAIVVGAGGILAELVADAAMLLAPFDERRARGALEQLAIGRLLQGFRNLEPADLNRLAGAMVTLGDFAIRNPHIASVDLNPLIVSDDGGTYWAVDCKIVEAD